MGLVEQQTFRESWGQSVAIQGKTLVPFLIHVLLVVCVCCAVSFVRGVRAGSVGTEVGEQAEGERIKERKADLTTETFARWGKISLCCVIDVHKKSYHVHFTVGLYKK